MRHAIVWIPVRLPDDVRVREVIGMKGGTIYGLPIVGPLRCDLPPAMTPEAQSLIDYVCGWVEDPNAPCRHGGVVSAVDRYRVSLAVYDPVAEVIAAWSQYDSGKARTMLRMTRAVNALEASRRP